MSDYLSDEEQLTRLKSWWDENGLMLVGGVVLAISSVVGYRWYDASRAEEIASAADLYARYLDAEPDARAGAAEIIEAEIPKSSYHTLVLLRTAQENVEAEDYAAAETNLQAALVSAESGLADLTRLRLARVLQQLDRSDDALAILGGVRGDGFRPQVAELKGDIHLARGERTLAHEAYSAALDGLSEGTQRPLLELKVADTADAADA